MMNESQPTVHELWAEVGRIIDHGHPGWRDNGGARLRATRLLVAFGDTAVHRDLLRRIFAGVPPERAK